jgi:hypothetical protein
LGFETSRLPHFLHTRLTDGIEVASLTGRQAAFYPPPPGMFLVPVSLRVYITSFIKIGSGIRKLLCRYTQTSRQLG